ncbi:hypothetical protein G6O69_01800 [Pseudenhygromyxa sp. WMMC2535]|uniref:hypothetical protein n=1 Tax=Pseudenhygromyxa sp. WMMC2535 TaxID=2712867 RepID=UPI001595D118|nr:hypothetical protein [Pseudenhygromyxa sp. WMMC2535]NVB36548.1 hypothetical protein [Pseudenhygromyxa sp. WMMC2535]
MSGGRGFHWASPPPADVGAEHNLRSEKPEPVIYAVLARARAGDFSCFHHLVRTMEAHDDAWVWGVGAELLSHAAPTSLLRSLPSTLKPVEQDFPAWADVHAQWTIEILGMSNYLWTAPVIFDLYRGIENKLKYSSACFMLSRLLEPEWGPVFFGPEELPPHPDEPDWYIPPKEYDVASYLEGTAAKIAEVTASLPSHSCVWGGRVLALEDIAREAIVHIRERREPDITYTHRMLLEAYTGCDLTGFYLDNGRHDTIAAIAMLEQLLETGNLDQYEPGVRYFFGRRVPD